MGVIFFMLPPRSKILIGRKRPDSDEKTPWVSGRIARFSSPGNFATGFLVGGPCSVTTLSAGRGIYRGV